MVYSTTKPIIITFEGIAGLQYHTYIVALRYTHNGQDYYNTIFEGRAWSDATRRVKIRIDDLLRSYVSHWQSDYDGQQQQPAELLQPTSTIYPIEDGSKFFVNSVLVECAGVQQYFNVWGGFITPWQGVDIPTDSEDAVQFCNLSALGSGIVPHVPPLSTSNMHLGLAVYMPRVENCEIGFSIAHRVALSVRDAGTLRAAFRLADLFDALQRPNTIDGGTPTSTPTAAIDGGTPTSTPTAAIDGGTPSTRRDEGTLTTGTLYLYHDNDKDVLCVADACAADYYVAWETPQGGWACYGFGGNATIGGALSTTSIRTFEDTDSVLNLEQQHTFNLYTEPVGREVYNHLATLKYTREVVVYDSKRDKGYYCTVDGRNIDTMPSRQTKLKAFSVTLKEQQHLSL